jgi:CHAT domain-containing protein
MSRQRPSSCEAWPLVLVVLYHLLLSQFAVAAPQTTAHQDYVPPELLVTDPNVKAALESADKSGKLGQYGECLKFLQKALELATSQKALADRAIVEDKFAVYYFTQGKLEDAKAQWINSLSDGVTVSNLVLQADVLVALSALQQISGHLDQAMKTAQHALDLSRRSKDFYIESRVLGELSRLQLLAGKQADARVSIEEALQIDRFNRYDWEPVHLLYLANLSVAESKTDKALEIGKSARDLAVKNENYLVFILSSMFLGQGYVQTGQVEEGIRMMELSRKGVSGQNKPLFQFPEGYDRTASLPYLKIAFLEALAGVYEAAKRHNEALKTWQVMYETATASNFALARAESARKQADLYKAQKDLGKAIELYSLAADASATAGNEQSRIEALTSEEVLLFQQGEKQKALNVEEELLSSAKASKNPAAQFVCDLVVVEILDGTGKMDRVESALKEAESLVGSDVKVPGVGPSLIVELYLRLADFYKKREDVQHELISLEKAITPAIVLANAPKEAKNSQPLVLIVQRLETTIPNYHIRDAGEAAYANGKFGDALVLLELLQYFEEVDASWKGKYDEYTKNLGSDPVIGKLLQIPPKVISQGDGVVVLTNNIDNMGPIADRVKLTSLMALTSYYMLHQRPDMIVRVVTQALPYLKLGQDDSPNGWDVAMSCELAYALMLEKDLKSAVEELTPCITSAKKFSDAVLLRQAHQINVWVLEAAGKHDQAQESIQFLLNQKPDDPLEYVQLAQLKARDGDRPGSADAWKKAISLYEIRNNLTDAAAAHVALANLLNSGSASDPEGRREHLEAADALYRKLGSGADQATTEIALGEYYTSQRKYEKARQCFEAALKLARGAKRKDLEAHVMSNTAQAFETAGDLAHATEHYRSSADVYRQLNDHGNEAFQLKNLANTLVSSHKSEEALETLVRAKAVADTSDSWAAQYWVRRSLAEMYGSQGQYQKGLTVLQEAKQISDNANQILLSAWASLDVASGLEIVGSWQEALDQINLALPVLKQFKDTDDEYIAYTELSAIYGARESELKDLQKALEFYQRASQLVAETHPERAAALNLDIVEIYWQMGRFKDAITKATEALTYFGRLKNELGEAGALISLAEAQRSDGNLEEAAKSLERAEPLVMRANNFYTIGRLYYGQAGLYRAQGRLDEASHKYELVVSLLEQFKSTSSVETRRKVSENYDFIYDDLIETYYALSKKDQKYARSSADKALEYAELNKAQAFAHSWGQAFLAGLKHQVPLPLQGQETSITNQRAALQSERQEAMTGATRRSVKRVEEELVKLGRAESLLEDQLRRTSPAYAEVRYPQRMNIREVPLKSGELLVQFKVLDHSTLVWLLEGSLEGTTLAAFYKVDRPRQWFSERIFRIRDAFNGGHPEQFDPKITDDLLSALFPDSALQSLKAAKAIIFVPDDVLFLLPFEMLSSHGEYVLLATPTEYFPSSAALRLARTMIRATGDWQQTFIGIADPITSSDDPRYQAVSLFSDPSVQTGQTNNSTSSDRIVSRGFSLERLPGTADEVRGIAGLFASTPSTTETRTGMNATKQELLRTDLARYKFVHFATHGILPVEAGIQEPSLVLSYDGRGRDDMLLTLSEILELKLRADMVVLSACNTGSGKVTKAEGVASLGTAFLAAGASSVTVSLWHVADNSTAELMEEFYKNLVKGKTKSESLAAARSALFSKDYVNHNPYFWAPFVLTGE